MAIKKRRHCEARSNLPRFSSLPNVLDSLRYARNDDVFCQLRIYIIYVPKIPTYVFFQKIQRQRTPQYKPLFSTFLPRKSRCLSVIIETTSHIKAWIIPDSMRIRFPTFP
jgi:hypothetical protein